MFDSVCALEDVSRLFRRNTNCVALDTMHLNRIMACFFATRKKSAVQKTLPPTRRPFRMFPRWSLDKTAFPGVDVIIRAKSADGLVGTSPRWLAWLPEPRSPPGRRARGPAPNTYLRKKCPRKLKRKVREYARCSVSFSCKAQPENEVSTSHSVFKQFREAGRSLVGLFKKDSCVERFEVPRACYTL